MATAGKGELIRAPEMPSERRDAEAFLYASAGTRERGETLDPKEEHPFLENPASVTVSPLEKSRVSL